MSRAMILFLAVAAIACGPANDHAAATASEPTQVDDQPGAVCGMMVRDQPAPRGQVVHRDGTRQFVCSLGDLLVYLSAPSPHGQVQSVFVEVLEPDGDPLASSNSAHPWVDARAANYVVGVPRRAIMGPPVLAYRDVEDASRVAGAYSGAQVLDFDGLKQWWEDRP